jgi:Flp pilus assembly protein CpaB
MSTATQNRAVSRGRLPVARRSRRPALAALALLLVLAGALGSALVAYRSGSRVDVLVASHDIPVGKQISASDLHVARVAADSGNVVEAQYLSRFVGSFATGRIPQGTLVNARMFKVGDVIPAGAQLVGMVLDTSRRTTQRPQEGDVVRIYYVSQAGGQPVGNVAPGDTIVRAARVMQVGRGSGSDGTSVTVLVKDNVAGLLAEFAASGSLAVSVLPEDTRPAVDVAR